jgi:hypothetical protein
MVTGFDHRIERGVRYERLAQILAAGYAPRT